MVGGKAEELLKVLGWDGMVRWWRGGVVDWWRGDGVVERDTGTVLTLQLTCPSRQRRRYHPNRLNLLSSRRYPAI